jgi:hypothetical protein
MMHFKASKLATLAAISLLGLGVTHSAHAATTWIFDYTGGVQTFDVTRTGVYDVTAYGAQGGAAGGFADGGPGGQMGGATSLSMQAKC